MSREALIELQREIIELNRIELLRQRRDKMRSEQAKMLLTKQIQNLEKRHLSNKQTNNDKH